MKGCCPGLCSVSCWCRQRMRNRRSRLRFAALPRSAIGMTSRQGSISGCLTKNKGTKLLWTRTHVVVEWLYYSKRIIIDKKADLTACLRRFSSEKCVFFVSRSMKIVTFLRKNGETAKRVVEFPRERDTFRNKIMEIVEDFDEKSYNNNGKP